MKTGKELHLVIRITSTNEFVGRAGLHPAMPGCSKPESGSRKSAQRHGYGREAGNDLMKTATDRDAEAIKAADKSGGLSVIITGLLSDLRLIY